MEFRAARGREREGRCPCFGIPRTVRSTPRSSRSSRCREFLREPVVGRPDSGASAPLGDTGSVGLNLDLGPGITLKTVALTTSRGTDFTSRVRSTSRTAPKITALIGGIPAGHGFVISLSGAAVGAGGVSVHGSGDVRRHRGRNLDCERQFDLQSAGTTGSVLVNGTDNIIPIIDGVSIRKSR